MQKHCIGRETRTSWHDAWNNLTLKTYSNVNKRHIVKTPNRFAFAQGARARHQSARKSGPNSLAGLPINSRNIVCIRKCEQQPLLEYLCAFVVSEEFYAELSPSLRYTTFLCECFRLACPVYELRVRMRAKHWETAGSLYFSRGIQINRSVWKKASLLTAHRSSLKNSYAGP